MADETPTLKLLQNSYCNVQNVVVNSQKGIGVKDCHSKLCRSNFVISMNRRLPPLRFIAGGLECA